MVECFAKKKFNPIFKDGGIPRLLYVSKAETKDTKLPRIMHVHENRLEILFIREGKGIHTIGGREYHTKKGDILIYNSGVIHDERANPEAEMSVYNCGVNNLKLEGLNENCLLPDDVSPVINSGEFYKDIEHLFEMIYFQISSGKDGAEEICNYLASSLIIIILKQVNKTADSEKNEEDILGQRIKNYIDAHYAEDLTLEYISETLNISLSYLSHAFKKSTGYSPIQYIMHRRIGEAQTLLINTGYSATEIAFLVGYNDSNYFNTTFTKIVGMSPIKYRKYWVDKKIEEK